MLNPILVLAAAAACHALPHRLHPSSESFDPQIVGGLPVDIKDYPWQVSMRQYNSHICGGSILSEKWVLTAGHCVHALYGDASTASVRVGSTSQGDGGQIVNAVAAFTHPDFDYDTLTHDVALLQLEESLDIDGVSTRATKLVPEGTNLDAGQLLAVSGWGTLHSGDWSLPDHLMAVMVPSLPRQTCAMAYSTRGLTIDDTMICAGVGGKDSCQGDSGGPLVDDMQVQVGVVSWGIGCATPGYPGVYANLAHPSLQQWIRATAGL